MTDTHQIKRLSLIAAIVVVATLNWAVARPWLENSERFTNWHLWILPSLTVILLGATVSLGWMLLDRWYERLAAILASWATFIFFWPPNPWYLTLLPVFGLLWYEAARETSNDQKDRRKVRVSTTIGQGMKMILLGAFAMVSLGYYLIPSTQAADASTVSQNLQATAEGTTKNPIVEQQLSQLPKAVQEQVRQEMASNIDKYVRKYLGPISNWVPPILAFGLFIILWSISIVFRLLAIGLGWWFFRILETTGFVKVEEKDVKAEVVSL